MTDADLTRFGAGTRVSPGFTGAVLAAAGLDRYLRAPSALGDVFVAWSPAGVSALRPAGDADAFERWYRERFARTAVPAVEEDAVADAVRARLAGAERDVPLDLRACSPFERRVLEKAAEISRGNARPYTWVAREIGAPGAMRAVGNALGHNPVPLLIPCHRVIRGDGTLGSYAFGAAAKRTLLQREGLDVDTIESLARRGVRYIASDEDGTFCLPTCGNIATLADRPGYRVLRTLAEAHACGLVPCAECRPIAA